VTFAVFMQCRDMTFLPKGILSWKEWIADANFVDLGVQKLRFTGASFGAQGYHDLSSNRLTAIGRRHAQELTLTTNGSQLERLRRDFMRAVVAPSELARWIRWHDQSLRVSHAWGRLPKSCAD